MSSVQKRKYKNGWSVYLVVPDGKGGWRQGKVVARGLATKKEAEAAVAAAKKAIQRRELRAAGLTAATYTVGEALDEYLAELGAMVARGQRAASSLDGFERSARIHVRPRLNEAIASELDARDVQKLVDEMCAAGKSAQTVRHAVGTLRAALNAARRRRRFSGETPFDRRELVLPKQRRKAKEVLTPAEMRPVLEEIPEALRPFTAAVLMSGIRPAELLRLTPPDVDLRRGMITVTKSKTGDERRVPIGKDLRPYLKTALSHAKPDCLFPEDRGEWKHRDRKLARMLRTAMVKAATKGVESLVTGWTLKCRRKGCGHSEHAEMFLPDKKCPECDFTLWPVGHPRPVRYYDLRHTAATNMVSQGVPSAVAARILGHSEDVLLSTYVHLQDETLREAAEKMGLPDEDAPRVFRMRKRRKRRT